jgi:RNA polymerase sigma factor (sigma-70 family)
MQNFKPKIDSNYLVTKFGPIVSGLSHRMIVNRNIAKEAAQEVWFEIIKSLDSFKGESNISTWVYIIAKRTILRYSKSEKVYKSHEINDHFDLKPIEYYGLEQDKKEWVKEKCDRCLTAFCHCLKNESRLIFLFREIAGLEYDQISEIMGISPELTRKALSRSKEKVRNFMDKNCVLYNPKGECKCRIRKYLVSVDLDIAYNKLAKAVNLIDFFQKFDLILPYKNYWEKFVVETVTN